MTWAYDGHSRTIYDADTGDVIARDMEPEHGALIVAVPGLSKDEAIKSAVLLLNHFGWTVTPPGSEKWGCHVELHNMPDAFEPDGCVIDDGLRSDCIYASNIAYKEQCRYWKRITPASIKEARHG